MQLFEFVKQYPDEASCKALFHLSREKNGITCRKCNSIQHHWMPKTERYRCLSCGFQTTLRSGTLLEASNLPYRYWLYALALMTNTKKSISALEMQRQLGHKRYEPIWAMMHKIRLTMGNRDERYKLEELVEIDDAFFKTYSDENKGENKPGRGTTSNSNVLVMCRVDSGKEKHKHGKDTAFRYVKMMVMPNQEAVEVEREVAKNIATNANVMSDGWQSFSGIKKLVNSHLRMTVKPKVADKVLPWVHTTISNSKRQLLGIHSGVKDIYLQNYLNEFCYKTNRRYFGFQLFERVLAASVDSPWYKTAVV